MTWAEISEWANTHSGVFGFGAFVLSALALLVALRQLFNPRFEARIMAYKDQMDDPASRDELIAELRSGWGDSYARSVGWLLGFADRFWGPSLRWRAFDRCLFIAFLYPVVAAVLGWTFFNIHSPGGLVLFLDEPRLSWRLLRTAGLMVGLSLSLWIASRSEDFSLFVLDIVFGRITTASDQLGLLLKLSRSGLELIIFTGVLLAALAGAFASVLTVAFSSAVAIALAIAVALAGVISGEHAVAVAVAAAFAFAGTVAVSFALAGAIVLAVGFALNGTLDQTNLAVIGTVLLFYAVLPALNAIADFYSLAVTRFLVARPARKTALPNMRTIWLKSLFDIVWAVVCLACLLWATTAVMDYWQSVHPASMPFDWRGYWENVQRDWTQGFALYLMVFTTLLPTLAHMAVGLSAGFTYRSRLSRRVANTLEQVERGEATWTARRAQECEALLRRAVKHGRLKGGLLALAGYLALVAAIIWVLLRL